MKTNKISAMLLSAAIACTPVLSSAAQIVASAEETTTTTAAAAESVAAPLPVAVNTEVAVVAAEDDPATTTEAPATTAAPATEGTKGTEATTTVPQKVGNASVVDQKVDNNWSAGKAMVKGMAEIWNNPNDKQYDAFNYPSNINTALIAGSDAFNKATKANPNFNKTDTIYGFRMPDANQGKMLYTPNPRWFINTPTPAVVGGSGSTATITWDPVPMADGYRYTIRTYVIEPSTDSHDYSFEHTHNKTTNLVPPTVTIDKPSADAKGQDADPTVADKILTGDTNGQLTEHAANNPYNVDRYPTRFRVKEDFTVNGKWQRQDATTTYTVKENWKEFTNDPDKAVVGYTYNLEKPSVSVAADVPVRVEIMIQAFRIDNATGELYNLSDVSEPRIVDLNWVAKESWEGMLGAPDQYEDEFFRAAYHKLDEPTAPEKYEVHWKSVTLPVTSTMVDKGIYTLQGQEKIDPQSGYVIEPGNQIDDPTNKDKKIDTWQVKYETFTMNLDEKGNPVKDADGNYTGGLKEVFDLKNKKVAENWDTSDTLKNSGTEGAARWKLNTSINQAEKDNVTRWEKAYAEWKKQELDPIAKWNSDHASQIEKAWRTAYKEAIKAYAVSEYANDKRFSMRYGLLDLDRNGVPELIVSFSSKADKNSYVVIDFQQDRAKLRTVKDANYTEWYYEDVLGACAKRGRCFKLDNLAPIDSWTAADDEKDPLATTTTSSGSSSASSSASSSSGSSSSASASTDGGAPKTGDAGVAGLAAAAFAAVAGMFATSRRKKN